MNKIIPARYKLLSEEISGDGVSNVMYLKRRYSLPRIESKITALLFFHSMVGERMVKNHAKIIVISVGWGDAYCQTIQVILLVIPNDGKINYS